MGVKRQRVWAKLGAKPVLIGHRGYRSAYPENTLSSFRMAYKAGARMVECDVQLSRDGIPVIMHDENINRTTGVSGKISTMNWNTLKKLDAGSWFSPRFGSDKIPSLSQVMALMPAKALIYIEIKSFDKTKKKLFALCDVVAKKVIREDRANRSLLASFDPRVFAYIKLAYPNLRTGLIFQDREQLIAGEKMGFHLLDVLCPRFNLVTKNLMNKAHRKGLLVFAWTARRYATAKRLQRLGVDGIAFDDLELGTRMRKKGKSL